MDSSNPLWFRTGYHAGTLASVLVNQDRLVCLKISFWTTNDKTEELISELEYRKREMEKASTRRDKRYFYTQTESERGN